MNIFELKKQIQTLNKELNTLYDNYNYIIFVERTEFNAMEIAFLKDDEENNIVLKFNIYNDCEILCNNLFDLFIYCKKNNITFNNFIGGEPCIDLTNDDMLFLYDNCEFLKSSIDSDKFEILIHHGSIELVKLLVKK